MAGTAVVIPFYQRAPGLLTAAIRSVLAQEGLAQGAGPVTIVVCDDASPSPASAELAALEPAERERIVLITQTNQGAGAARNAALDSIPPNTEWIAFLDSDDCWYPEHLARAVTALQQGYDFCFADARREHEEFTHFEAAGFHPDQHEPISEVPRLYGFTGNFLTTNIALSPVSISTVVMRASMLGDLRFMPIAVEDLLYWLEIAQRKPRVALDGTLQVLYGKGAITITESWKSPAALRMSLLYHHIFMRVAREFELTAEQRAILAQRMAGNRRSFCMVALAQLRVGAVPAWRIVQDFLVLDPRVASAFVFTAAAEMARRLPFGHYAGAR